MEQTASLFRMSKLAANKSQLNTPLSNDDSDNNTSDRRNKIRFSEKGERPVPGFAFAGMMESFKQTGGVIFEKGADLDSTSKARDTSHKGGLPTSRSRSSSSQIKNENSNSKEKPKVYVKTIEILKMVEKVISLKKKRAIFIYSWRKL